MSQYVTKDGDTVDLIVWNYYKRQSGRVVEQVLDANPALANLGVLLSAGVTIELPDIEEEADANTGVKLWD